MGGRSTKPELPQNQPPTREQLQAATNVISLKGGKTLEKDTEWKLKENRSCTDCLFWIIFLLFQGGCIVIAGFGFAYGKPDRLLYGYDSLGNACAEGGNSDKTYLYYPAPMPAATVSDLSASIDLSWSVCVKKCPLQIQQPGAIGSTSQSLPNMCSKSFQVSTKYGKIITCGGGPDQDTDMNQFYNAFLNDAPAELQQLHGINGYLEYCLKNNPVCTCPNGNPDSNDCCDGNNPQAVDAGFVPPRPKVVALTDTRSVLGVTIGYKFGFCFIPYPSAALTFTSRCTPLMPETPTLVGGNTQTGSSGLTASAAYTNNLQQVGLAHKAINSAATVPQLNQSDVGRYMHSSVGGLLGSFGGSQETFNSLCAEVYENKWVILGSAGIALLVSLVYTQLLRFFAKELCVVVLALTWALLAICTAVISYKAGIMDTTTVSQTFETNSPATPANNFQYNPDNTYVVTPTTPNSQTLGQPVMNQNLLIIAAVVVGVTFLAYNVILCVMYRRIMLAAEVIEEAGRCVAAMPVIILFPLVQWIFIAAYFVWFIILFLYLASAGDFNTTTRQFEWNDSIRRCLILHMFAMLWARAIVLAVGNLVVAGATAQWFLAPNNAPVGSPVLSSIGRTFRYHLGTAFFGSAIIATVQFFRLMVQAYLYGVSRGNESNSLVIAAKALANCCLKCLERFLDFVNKNAYIQTAIEGTNFCSSAYNGFTLLLRNALRLAAIAGISTVFLAIGKVFVAALTGFISALIIMGGDIQNITSAPVFSVTVIVLIAFAVASAFMDSWELVIDTLFQCFCMDEEKCAGKTHLSLKSFVDDNVPKAKDLNMIAARA